MKKESFNPSDSFPPVPGPEKKSPPSQGSSGEKGQKSISEISSEDLDKIFFPEKQPRDSKDEALLRGPDLREIADLPTASSPPQLPLEKTEKPGIYIEDATPLPPQETPRAKQTFTIPHPERKSTAATNIPDFRVPVRRKKSTLNIKVKTPTSVPPQTTPSRDDITQVFVPADRIDASGNIMPAAEEILAGSEAARRKQLQPLYALMLAYGRRIHFKKTIAICAEFLDIAPDAAERRIRYGKGILFEHLTLATALGLRERFLSISQGIRIVRENNKAKIPEPKEILLWLFSRRHFQVQTEKEKLVLSWDEVQLMSAGSIRLHLTGNSYKKALDFIIGKPFIHLRIWDTTFNYKSSGITYDSLGKSNFLNLIKVIKRFTKKARLSPTLKELIDHNFSEPKHFESLEEFDNYTRWLYLSFFGDPLR